MNTLVLSLVVFVAAVQGFQNQHYNHVISGNNYGHTRQQGYPVGNNANTQGNANGGSNGYQGNTRKSPSPLLPYLLSGGEMGGEMVAYSMMMNSNNNNMPLYYMMRNGEMNGLMLAFMEGNRGGRGVNPFTMSMMMGYDL